MYYKGSFSKEDVKIHNQEILKIIQDKRLKLGKIKEIHRLKYCLKYIFDDGKTFYAEIGPKNNPLFVRGGVMPSGLTEDEKFFYKGDNYSRGWQVFDKNVDKKIINSYLKDVAKRRKPYFAQQFKDTTEKIYWGGYVRLSLIAMPILFILLFLDNVLNVF